MWAFALYFLSVLALAYWLKWWNGEMNIFWPILFTTLVAFVIWQSKHRKHLIIFSLAFYIVFSLKTIFIDQQVGLGLFFLLTAFALAIALELLFPDREDAQWLYEEDSIGDDTSLIMDIGLREEPKSAKSQQKPSKEGTN